MLEKIKSPSDVKNLNTDELTELCADLRNEIITSVSENGGHLASNLGVVELTLAVYRTFDLPNDKLVFDVGHQAYAHKMLSGRLSLFENLRTDGGVSGFTKRSESEYDPFGSGHSGNALSSAMGLAAANKLDGKDDYTVAVIGDGGFTNGMTYEALNNCADKDLKLIIVLNDNEMAISPNVGSINNVFNRLRVSKGYFKSKNRFVDFFSAIPFVGKPIVNVTRHIKNGIKRVFIKDNFFETLGYDYIGPVDGNDVKKLVTVLGQAKLSKRICVVHAYTKKGKGYAFAEEKPDSYHSVGKFDVESGFTPNGKEKTFSYNVGKCLEKYAENDKKIYAVTAAMTAGTGLSGFASRFPERFDDVGIAEEHAVTFCAGLSAGGYKPVFAVYSTFMQRAFDQILEDAAIQDLRLTLLIDRAGLVADDGVTHHGIYDVSLLNSIKDTLIYSVDTLNEIDGCMAECLSYDGVSALRYQKGGECDYDRDRFTDKGTFAYVDFGDPDKVIITYGRLTSEAYKAAESIGNTRLIKLKRLKPLDLSPLASLTQGKKIMFVEEGVKEGGIAESVMSGLGRSDMKIRCIDKGLPGHGRLSTLLHNYGLDAGSIANGFDE